MAPVVVGHLRPLRAQPATAPQPDVAAREAEGRVPRAPRASSNKSSNAPTNPKHMTMSQLRRKLEELGEPLPEDASKAALQELVSKQSRRSVPVLSHLVGLLCDACCCLGGLATQYSFVFLSSELTPSRRALG